MTVLKIEFTIQILQMCGWNEVITLETHLPTHNIGRSQIFCLQR